MLGTRLLAFFSLILITSIFFPQVARAYSDPNRGKGQVLFINQVRGRECCDVGSLRALHEQLDVFAELQLPVFFTLRSDAIADPLIVETLQEYRAENTTISLGIFLEITPLLAAESGVAYPTSAERWYEAQAAYLIGYAPEDRIKIIDYVFENFFETFGYYPELTTAWMIDTPSLNYINEKYGVKVHQITREQWGTDSYTLQGGPAHYPYPASRNWLFVPDYATETTASATASASATPSAVIVRQTLTDPLANYGDGTASFTSQPNDYLQNKDFSYFEKLFTQAMEQPSGQMGFALIGLENSMPEVSQTEYLRQLQFIHEYAATNQLTFVADVEAFSHYWKTQPVSVYAGENLTTQTGEEIEKAWWITTPQYRARVRQSGEEVYLNDLRIYDTHLQDPYATTVAQEGGYWITPFLIDGSRFFDYFTWWQHFFNRDPWWAQYGLAPQKDLTHTTQRIVLAPASGVEESKKSETTVELTLSGEQSLLFTPESLKLQGRGMQATFENTQLSRPQPLQPDSTGGVQWLTANQEVVAALRTQCQADHCILTPELNAELFERVRQEQFPYFQPETSTGNAPSLVTYPHNRYAIAGRNPTRMLVIAQDTQAFPTQLEQAPTITHTNPETTVSELQQLQAGIYFFDITSEKPGRDTVTITNTITNSAGESAGDSAARSSGQTLEETVYFAPNCKNEKLYCLTHPRAAWWYLQVLLRDQFRE